MDCDQNVAGIHCASTKIVTFATSSYPLPRYISEDNAIHRVYALSCFRNGRKNGIFYSCANLWSMGVVDQLQE